MKIDTDQTGAIRLQEVFSGVLLETAEGNQIGVCMRDDTLEINVCPGGVNTGNWWRVDMQSGRIESLTESHEPNDQGDSLPPGKDTDGQ